MSRQELRPAAEDRLKKRLVLEELARREGLAAKPEDIDAEIDRMSGLMGPESDRMREVLDTPGGRESVSVDLAIGRAQERAAQIARGEAPPLPEAPAGEAAPEPQAEPAAGETPEPEAEPAVEAAPPEPEAEPAAAENPEVQASAEAGQETPAGAEEAAE
jgi:trigger factor